MAAATPENIDHGQTVLPLSFDVDTSGLKQHEYVEKLITGADLQEYARLRHIDLLNPRSMTVQTSSNMGHYSVDFFHKVGSRTEEAIPVDTVERSGHMYVASVPHPKTGVVTPTALLFQGQHIGSAEFPNVTSHHTFKPSREQESTRVVGIHKKISAWKGFNDTDSLLAGVDKAGIDEGASSHLVVTEKDLNTGKDSAVYALIKRNPTNKVLLGGRYQKANKGIHTTHRGQHAYKMTQEDVHSAVKNLWQSLTTHSKFAHGFGVRITKLSGDKDIPMRSSGAKMFDKSGKPLIKTVDMVTNKPVGRTAVRVEITRQPLDAKLGFIPYENDVGVTDGHMSIITKTNLSTGSAEAPDASGFEDQLKGKNKSFTTDDVVRRVTITPYSELMTIGKDGTLVASDATA